MKGRHLSERRIKLKEKASVVRVMTGWERKGLEKGRQEGQVNTLVLQLKRRLGFLRPAMAKRITRLGTKELTNLAEALLDFRTPADLENWFADKAR